MRKKILITGAAGGMGRACSRLLGAGADLVLADVATEPLERFVGELRGEGYTVSAARAGDLESDAALTALIGDLGVDGPFAIVHTAGLSPSLTDWRGILGTNLIATEKLLRGVEQVLRPGSVAVLIASTAGHAAVSTPDVDKLLDAPLADGFLDGMSAVFETMFGPDSSTAARMAYLFSKRAVLRMAQKRAEPWARRGARILTISPGVILTPMGRAEMDNGAREAMESAPMKRAGSPMDIAFAARFLLSDEAAFITGTDLLVDGGAVGARHAAVV